jgi:dephospho-CoA kinase
MNKLVVGITGGIGSGKSIISNWLREHNFTIYDTDKIAHNILATQHVINDIKYAFGDDVVVSGKIDRKILGSKVFGNKINLQKLNSIVHPAVFKHMDEIVEKAATDIFFEIPLLFETHTEQCFDYIIIITAKHEIKLNRLIVRDNISIEDAKKRFDSQLSDEEKIAKSDFVIENSGTLDNSISQLANALESLIENKERNKITFIENYKRLNR